LDARGDAMPADMILLYPLAVQLSLSDTFSVPCVLIRNTPAKPVPAQLNVTHDYITVQQKYPLALSPAAGRNLSPYINIKLIMQVDRETSSTFSSKNCIHGCHAF